MSLLNTLIRLTQSANLAELGPNISKLTINEIIKALGSATPPNRGPVAKIKGIKSENGAYQARSVADVRRLVKLARSKKLRLRVAGSGHSDEQAVYSGRPQDFRVVLTGDLKRKTITHRDASGATVQVGGGCFLGINPLDRTSRTRPWTNLNQFLDRHKLALPILGGISHQSIAGFLQTGSAGGSLTYGLAQAIEAIDIVDGNGELRTLRGDDLNAAAVSMGLCGVVTGVTLRADPVYRVTGVERNVKEEASLIGGKGPYLLEKAMADSDYLHLNWFPQSSVNRVTEWVGKRTYKFGKVKPYRNQLRGKRKNIAAAIALEIMDQATNIDPEHAESIISAILNKFVPVSGPGSKSTFSDVWYDALPSDDQYETDTLLKVILMEVWIPMDKLEEALSRLKELFEHEPGAAGYFITELYGAKRSPFWLSPAYDRNVFRVDVFSWAHALHAQKAARKHFKFYWDALLDLDARLHWGKVLPKVNQQCGKVKFNPAFLRNAYPKLPKWLEFRRGMDPNGIFLSDYWKDILGIP